MSTERFEQLVESRRKAQLHIDWTVVLNAHLGLTPERILGMSDAIMEDSLLLLDIREILTVEEWRIFLQKLFKGTK
jgi:hypothetical protein